MHEIGHKWGMHPQRMAKLKATDPEIENIAMDLAFNCVLADQERYTTSRYYLQLGSTVIYRGYHEAYSKLLRDETTAQQRGDGDEGKDDNTMGDTGNEGVRLKAGKIGDEGSLMKMVQTNRPRVR